MGVGVVDGTKLFIGAAGSPPTSPDLWIEIGDVSSLGNIAQAFAEVAVNSIGDGDSYNLKGTRSFPNFEITLNRNVQDAGQAALKVASDAVRGTLYPFRVLEVDGTWAVWQGEVFGYGVNFGANNTLKQVVTSISIRPSTYSTSEDA